MVVRKKEGMTTVVAARGVKGGEDKAGEGSAYRKGMFLAFIDDAFLQRSKVRSFPFRHSRCHTRSHEAFRGEMVANRI